MQSSDAWLATAWPALLRGRRVVVPPDVDLVGWRIPRASDGVGQSVDLVRPLSDGSRIHVHVFPNGARVAHRDRIDPGRGPIHAVAHVALETSTGRAVGLALLARTAWRLLF